MTGQATLTLRLDDSWGLINPNLYGHFIEHLGRCIEEGIWVGPESSIPNTEGLRNDTVAAFKALNPPVLRWPGGCFADLYHWEDGIGPRERRPRRVNAWWYKEEDNHFGTDEFLQFCRLTGAEPYICGNVGSGSPREMMNWVEYCNYGGDSHYARLRAQYGHPEPYGVKYWGVGNENWGCGGAYDPECYAREYRRYALYLRRLDPSLQLIACGHTTRDWNLRFLETLGRLDLLDHLSIHRYYGCGHETEFTDQEYYDLYLRALQVDADIRRTEELLSFFGQGRFIGLVVDEWGVWHPQAKNPDGLYQQNTLRDALVAASVLDVFNRWAAKVTMANLAQTVNVLQCVIQTEGAKMWLTPTYHVFSLYRPHQGATSLRVDLECDSVAVRNPEGRAASLPVLSASASRHGERGELTLTVTNRHLTEPQEVAVRLRGEAALGEGRQWVLTAEDVRMVNRAEQPEAVVPTGSPFPPGKAEFTLVLPPKSLTTLVVPLR